MSEQTPNNDDAEVTFHKVLELGELPEGRVTTVNVGHQTFAVTHYDGIYDCLDNKCPH